MLVLAIKNRRGVQFWEIGKRRTPAVQPGSRLKGRETLTERAPGKIHRIKKEILNKRLLKAASRGDADMVNDLLDKGADVDAIDGSDPGHITPLMMAVSEGHMQAAMVLIDGGADVNAKDSCGMTPLMKAAYWGCIDTVIILINNGADINASNDFGDTPLSLAFDEGHGDVAYLLRERGGKDASSF
jgi:ankyrin repeat protein